MTGRPRVAVVGAGIAGVAAAQQLARVADVTVFDRGRRIGGRLATRIRDGRVVDIGASYFTIRDDRFHVVVDDWVERGLARPWTDTFHVSAAGGRPYPRTGPMRYAAVRGLRSLVEDLAQGLAIEEPVDVRAVVRSASGVSIDGVDYDAVVLAMPDPQAVRLLESADPLRAALTLTWEPVLALTATYAERAWDFDAIFVNDDPVLSFVADDGSRRGDSAAVLVAHSGPVFAVSHLADPPSAIPAMLAALRHLVPGSDPVDVDVHRWTYAKPVSARSAPCHFDGVVGVCGDGWHDGPRVETAWCSGDALGAVIAEKFAPTTSDPGV